MMTERQPRRRRRQQPTCNSSFLLLCFSVLYISISSFQIHAWSPAVTSLFTDVASLSAPDSASSLNDSSNCNSNSSRRRFISRSIASLSSIPIINVPFSSAAHASTDTTTVITDAVTSAEKVIFTAGYGREEYTNSITASRDTNISPKEVYDSIQSSYIMYPIEQLKKQNSARVPRAFDVGAGAGVSTQTLYLMGYTEIEAVDWSSKAWDENVDEELLPKGVNFHSVDDESFLMEERKKGSGANLLFDVIVFNFSVNESKARSYAKTMLQPEGRLLAPVNIQTDYWLKQAFKVYDSEGNVLWSANDVGAWSVQFQPDVTQDTCQGIWCAPYNGFKKKR